ncbi:2,3-diaminopropionate biosynthesis protein SbnB [Exiguobacterium sp. s189]|uniref:2,3-diaminopropionate biosynthesis protein SbnB n=1 Tax=Exiguobacterium sp. s189 TaxID=2751263 RepID=UPI001BEAC01E|nr:2,3-diaminopropionate biosynthesis protein SbnB [Exiguobacterium sp. s189]
MLYLNQLDIENCNIAWSECIKTIDEAINYIREDDFSQPIKPYLDFNNPQNRIIAMPARVGNDRDGIAGIKWIASFPDNLNKGIPRANSLTVLNDTDTGQVLSIINTSVISSIRTASVTGSVMKDYFGKEESTGLTGLIIGYGPIGQRHLSMISEMFSERFDRIYIYDKYRVDEEKIPENIKSKVRIVSNYEDGFELSDVVITCTTSSKGYIKTAPKKGSFHLNVSLRDYDTSMQKYFDVIIVDLWDEVCRANTDIELMSQYNGLSKENVIEIPDVKFIDYKNKTTFFNPMGMASFDIKIGELFYKHAKKNSIGKRMI